MGITVVEVVSAGPQGIAGVSTVAGGTTNQVLAKKTDVDYDVEWAALDAANVLFTSITGLEADNTADAIDEVNTIVGEVDDNIGLYTELTGVVSIDDIVTLNTDITLIDIAAFEYFIQGTKYSYAGATGVTPTIAADDSSTWVGVDATGIIYSDEKWSVAESQTILSLARLQAVQGQSGPSSELQSPVHLVYSIGQNGFVDSDWIGNTIGALYASGGTFTENGVNPLQVNQAAGEFHTAQRKHVEIDAANSIQTSVLYHVSGAPVIHDRAVLTIPKFWDNGTDKVALSSGYYASHTLLRSPKAEDLFILVYSNEEYISQNMAENANIDFSLFGNQATSGLVPVARFIIKDDSTNIVTIIDERPSIIDKQLSAGNVSDMQQIFDNSESPEIVTDDTRGALSIKRGSTSDTDNIIEGIDGADDVVFSVTGEGAITGTGEDITGIVNSNVMLTNSLGSVPAIDNMEGMIDNMHSAGVMSGCALTDNDNGTINIAAGYGFLRDAATETASLWAIEIAAQDNVTMFEGINYVSLDWHSGAPEFTSSPDRDSFNCLDICIAYVIVRNGNTLNWLDATRQNVDVGRKTRRMLLQRDEGFIHLTGGTILEDASSLAISVSEGVFNFMLEEIPHTAFDTSIAGTATANVFKLYYRDGGSSYTEVDDQKVVDTAKHDNGSGTLATLDSDKFGVTWFYMVINTPNELVAMVGQETFTTIAEAKIASAPTLTPALIEGLGALIGFTIYSGGSSEFTDVLSAFAPHMISSKAVSHDSLANIQGGAVDDYQHLTTAQVTTVNNIGTENHMEVINLTGIDIPAGKAVRHNGVTSGNVKAVLALADTFQNATILGITTITIPDGEIGLVTTFGEVSNIDTDGLPIGTPLYLSDTVAGDFIATAPIIRTQVGGAIEANDTTGRLFVTIENNEPLPVTLGSLLEATAPTSLSADLVNATAISSYSDSLEIVTEANEVTGVLTIPLDGIYRVNFSLHMTFDNVGQSGNKEFYVDLRDVTSDTLVKSLKGFILDSTEAYSLTDNGAATLVGGHDYRLELRSEGALTNFAFSSSTFYLESILY